MLVWVRFGSKSIGIIYNVQGFTMQNFSTIHSKLWTVERERKVVEGPRTEVITIYMYALIVGV